MTDCEAFVAMLERCDVPFSTWHEPEGFHTVIVSTDEVGTKVLTGMRWASTALVFDRMTGELVRMECGSLRGT